MYRVHLTDAQRDELERRAHDPKTKPRTRDRLEMVRLSAAGWSVPRLARHFRCHQETVRPWIKAFLARGFDALADRPHPGQPNYAPPTRNLRIYSVGLLSPVPAFYSRPPGEASTSAYAPPPIPFKAIAPVNRVRRSPVPRRHSALALLQQ